MRLRDNRTPRPKLNAHPKECLEDDDPCRLTFFITGDGLNIELSINVRDSIFALDVFDLLHGIQNGRFRIEDKLVSEALPLNSVDGNYVGISVEKSEISLNGEVIFEQRQTLPGKPRKVATVQDGDLELPISLFTPPAGYIARYQSYEGDDYPGYQEFSIHYHKGTKARRSRASACGKYLSTKIRQDWVYSDNPHDFERTYIVCKECSLAAQTRIKKGKSA